MSQITTHILDTAVGRPAENVEAVLYRYKDKEWLELGRGNTDEDGRIADLYLSEGSLPQGIYRINFDTAAYFEAINVAAFYPSVDIQFNVEGDGQHYHIPLLLSPFAYSTYRGS
ncbi:MAG: 5-hydroxyisourate hydrolase [Arenicella sp.]|jgi:5-hydroxyisourate hydrolase